MKMKAGQNYKSGRNRRTNRSGRNSMEIDASAAKTTDK